MLRHAQHECFGKLSINRHAQHKLQRADHHGSPAVVIYSVMLNNGKEICIIDIIFLLYVSYGKYNYVYYDNFFPYSYKDDKKTFYALPLSCKQTLKVCRAEANSSLFFLYS